ncbi:MAG: L-fucose isomerase, partial [Kiritimatiellae bacterium]|nr:L-fucose isomerase [Kiritimatiellia bacterium]
MNGFPKVGIRPIIDGRRRGVRESLEVQTMKMAETAAKLISSNLRYPDGSPVECVIADKTQQRDDRHRKVYRRFLPHHKAQQYEAKLC